MVRIEDPVRKCTEWEWEWEWEELAKATALVLVNPQMPRARAIYGM